MTYIAQVFGGWGPGDPTSPSTCLIFTNSGGPSTTIFLGVLGAQRLLYRENQPPRRRSPRSGMIWISLTWKIPRWVAPLFHIKRTIWINTIGSSTKSVMKWACWELPSRTPLRHCCSTLRWKHAAEAWLA